jgi:hypothetical protein
MEMVPPEVREVEEEGRVDGKPEGRPESDEYVETGGLRWTLPFGSSGNLSWPFVTIRISPSRVLLRANFLGIIERTFEFEKSELQAVRRHRGLISTGAKFEHGKADYPSLIVFCRNPSVMNWMLKYPWVLENSPATVPVRLVFSLTK